MLICKAGTRLIKLLEVHPCLLRWIASFLEGRSQVVRIAISSSPPCRLNGSIPQGTRLGTLLFAVMVNDLICRWLPRAKFVNDLTVIEIIPRNVPHLFNHTLYQRYRRMQLITVCALTPQNVMSWRLTFSITSPPPLL